MYRSQTARDKLGSQKGKSPNQSACTLGLRTAYVSRFVNGMVLERPAREGESPVHENNRQQQDPEYRETRETLREVGGTTLQG